MNSVNHVENVKRYRQAKKKTYYFDFHKEQDKDCIEWLDRQKNRTGALRTLIRASIAKRKKQNQASQDRRARLRAENRCVDCGKQTERTLSGKCLCEECAERRKRYGREQ